MRKTNYMKMSKRSSKFRKGKYYWQEDGKKIKQQRKETQWSERELSAVMKEK